MKTINRRWKPCWLISLLLGLAMATPGWADVLRTHVDDTLYAADGSAAHGTVLISWPSFTTSSGVTVAKGSTSATLSETGELSILLAPNVGATPANTYYTAVFHLGDGTVSREFWVVPVSASDVKLDKVRVSVLPTSTAMQTVSKQYVDQAIARAIVADPLSDPSNPYVEKAGDTMTGPLLLPGDPTVPLQASTKNYVDTNVAQLLAGLDQKVTKIPTGTQIVTQPANTSLEVNRLNGELNVEQFKSASNAIDGIANTLATPECQAGGCEAIIKHTFASSHEFFSPAAPRMTHGVDHRGGMQSDYFVNPRNMQTGGLDAGEKITVIQTQSAADQKAASGTSSPSSYGLWVEHRGVAGGNNILPQNATSTPPYFKSNFIALNVDGTYNTQGQHVLIRQNSHCYGVGDCLIGSQTLAGAGGWRDSADEGIHPYDLLVTEEQAVFQGVCGSGCTTGSTSVKITATRDAGTQGDGRYLINKTPGKVLTGGALTGGNPNAKPFPTATFSGTNFPVSTLFELSNAIPPQATNMSPGTVTAAIVTSGVPAGYSTNTLAAPASSGLACVVDPGVGGSVEPTDYEMAQYTVIDSTHMQLTLNKPHNALATVSMGGLCGYGVEQTVDTGLEMRQVFPIVGTTSPTQMYYAGMQTQVLGYSFHTSGYLNQNLNIGSIQRSGGVVTVTTTGNLPVDMNGLTLTVAGVTDSSYNGSFVVTTTAANQLTYPQAGPNSTSSGGTIGILTGGYNIYPMAEVLSVMNPATQTVDGTMTLAPNNVVWAPNDTVEEPHFYQIRTTGDILRIWQQMPRPLVQQQAGIQYENTAGPGITGWLVNNAVPASSYLANGGTHVPPDMGLRVRGIWGTAVELTAGQANTIHVGCKPSGCNRWNSAYNLFALENSIGNGGTDYVTYDPLTSKMGFNMRGGQYSFSPTAFTAGTINATNLNVSTINGAAVGSGGAGGGGGRQIDIVTPGTPSIVADALTSCGTPGPNNLLNVCRANGYAELHVQSGGAGFDFGVHNTNGAYFFNNANARTYFGTNATERMSLSATGGLSVGNAAFNAADAGAGNLAVQGSVTATALVSKVQQIAYSATPVFSTSGNANRIVLTGNVTSSTIAAGADGQRMCMNIVQDSSGGRTFAWPSNMLGTMTVGTTAGKRNQQCFVYYAADSAWVAESAGVVNQ